MHRALDDAAQEMTCGRRIPTPCSARPAPAPAPGTRLTPGQDFPENLEDLPLGQVQLLHSRLTRQLEHEHLSPDGPHPVTLQRHRELVVELDYRDLTAPA